ncbi:hypothetical protein SMICM17S_06632 [Streptomyces microflavus]
MESLRIIDTWPVPTAAAAVVRADGTVLGTHGPTAHRFPLASVTKPLAAYAALVAYEEGALRTYPVKRRPVPAGPRSACFSGSGVNYRRGISAFSEPTRRSMCSSVVPAPKLTRTALSGAVPAFFRFTARCRRIAQKVPHQRVGAEQSGADSDSVFLRQAVRQRQAVDPAYRERHHRYPLRPSEKRWSSLSLGTPSRPARTLSIRYFSRSISASKPTPLKARHADAIA